MHTIVFLFVVFLFLVLVVVFLIILLLGDCSVQIYKSFVKVWFFVRLLELQFGMAYLGQICLGVGKLCLGQARLLRGHIAPLFHNRPLHLPGIGSRPGTHLLRHVHALLHGFQLGHQLRHMLARSLRFKATLLLWRVLHHSLNFVIALQWTLVECADENNV